MRQPHSTNRAELALEAGALEPGESVRMNCVFCAQPGRTLSLTHTMDGALLFNCFRANCGAKGKLGGTGVLLTAARTPKAKQSRAQPSIEEELRLVQGSGRLWGMTAEELNNRLVRYHEGRNRIALPILSPKMLVRGRVLRTMWGDPRTPKAISVPYTDEPMLSWNTTPCVEGDWVWVVEDIPSAIRLSIHQCRAVALNGTALTQEGWCELADNATRVVWALDRDALGRSYALDKESRLMFEDSATVLLSRDIKDMDEEELNACLYETCSPLS